MVERSCSSRFSLLRTFRPVLVAAAILAAGPRGVLAGEGIEPELRLGLQQELERVTAKYGAGLEADQRLVASKWFYPDGDGYAVYAILDTAGPELLTTERCRLELRSEDGKAWQVRDRRVEDSTQRLFQELPEPGRFFRFRSTDLEREGMRVRATAGTAAAWVVQGQTSRLVFSAADLSYAYAPPEEVRTPHLLYPGMKSNWKDQLVFTPDLVEIACDPVSCGEVLAAFGGLEETGREALDGALEQYLERRTAETDKRRAEDPFADFRLPDVAGFLRISVKKRGQDHWIHLESDAAAGHEVQFRVDGLGTLYGYPAQAARRSQDPIDIERRDDRGAVLYQVKGLRGTVEVAVLEPELLQADLVYTLEAKRDLDALPFSLETFHIGIDPEGRATVEIFELEDGRGRALSWIRRGPAEGIVLLPERVPAGSELTIHVEFRTRGSIYKVNPSYSYVARSGWLPFVRYADKIESFDMTVRAPAKYTTIGIGTKRSETEQDKVRITRWVPKSAVHFPTIIFGVYEEDAPKIKATRRDGTEIPVRVYVDRNSMIDWGIRLRQLRAPGDVAVGALNFYRERFGTDYPYGKLDLVNDPARELGAQAPASIVYLGSAIFRSEAALQQAYARDMTTIVEQTIGHEVAHQWWGSLVGPANERNYWFVESLAEYSSALFMEFLASAGYQEPAKGRAAYLADVKRWKDEILRSGLYGSVQDATSLWSNGGRTDAIYARGPYAFHILRETFGDEPFFAFLKTLATELAGREIVSRDIQRIAERALGGVDPQGRPYSVDLEWFFDQWIRGAGLPQYSLEVSQRPNEDGSFRLEGAITQRVFAGRHDVELRGVYYRGVVPLTVLGKDKQEYGARLVVEGPKTPFSLSVPSKPLEVVLNANGSILARPVLTGE